MRSLKRGTDRGMLAWCDYQSAARAKQNTREAAEAALHIVNLLPQPAAYRNIPLTALGEHNEATIAQMRNCMAVGNAAAGVICAGGHLGYAQPIGA